MGLLDKFKNAVLGASDDFENDVNEEFESEQDDNIVTLSDEDGNEVDYEFLDLIEYRGEEYVVLLPVEDDEDDDQVIILQVITTLEGEEYLPIEDDYLVQTIFEIFKNRNGDKFDFI